MERKAIFFVLPHPFLVRSFLCTPVFQHLVQMKDALGIDLVFLAEKESLRPYLEEHGCYWEPLLPSSGSRWERTSFEMRERFTHRMAVYRFNQIHGFAKHKRKQKISAQMKRQYRGLVRRKDAAPWYFGVPFPHSNRILERLHSLNYSRLMTVNRQIEAYFDRYNPALVVCGTIQSPYSASYVHYARQRGIPCIGGVRSWDTPTMDGLMARGVTEYWVWNGIMRDELEAYHGVSPDESVVTGAPQFDAFAMLDARAAGEDVRKHLGIPEGSRVLTFPTYSPRLGYGEPSIADHIVARIEAGGYCDEPLSFVIRSYPADPTFRDRFGHLERYPFVRLYETPQMRSFNPAEYVADTEFLGGLLALSDVLICGPGTVAIDAACLDTPVVNIRFDGTAQLPEPISARSHFEGDHYKKLLATGGTRVADSFEELDAAIRLYLAEPAIDSDGRASIRHDFAGWIDGRTSADRIIQRLYSLLGHEPADASTPSLLETTIRH